MKKKLIMMAVAIVVAFCASANTGWAGGYIWEYRINGDTAEIYYNGSVAIWPLPTGAVTIPSTLGGKPVTSIGDGTFYYCDDLTSVTIPDSVTSIGERAFYNCSGLTSVTMPDSVTRIGSSAFDGCYKWNETIINISDIAAWCTNALNGALRGQRRLFLGGEELFDLQIPEGVTNIGESAFEDCSSLTSVTIPDSVTSIGSSAFYGCSKLTSVTIPDSVTSIGDSTFYNCSGLTSVTIPNSVTSIETWAFNGCSGLTSVTIPNSVTNIGSYAFSDCSSLTSVTIPNSVTSIGSYAFRGCSGLTSVTIPNSVTSIGSYAFRGCSGLTSVTIPDSVTNIGYAAFYCCASLTNIVFEGNAPDIGEDVFVEVNPNCTVYVRPGTTGWGVHIPGTWNGLKIEYAEVLPPQVTVEINGTSVEFETAEDGRTRTAAVAAGTAAEDVKVIVGGVDVTAGFRVAVEGTTATVSLAEPVVGVAPEAAEEAAKDEDDPSGMLVEVAPAKIAAKPEPKSGEAVGALPVKAYEGLYYQAAWGSELSGLTTGEKVKATGPSLYLGVIKQTGEKGFYKLTVSEK